MNLATLYARRGQSGLEQLAKAANVKGINIPYLQRLLYVLTRRPSLERANVLIKASEQLWPKQSLTLEGLTNPVFYKIAIAKALQDGSAHETHVKRARPKPAPKPKADTE